MRIIVFTLLLAACSKPTAPSAPVSPCTEQRFEQAGFIVCRGRGREIEIRSGRRSFKALQKELGEPANAVAFAMNGGMFDDAGAPIGLMIEDGHQIHSINRRTGGGNFHLMPNGVFLVRNNGHAEVMISAAFKPHPDISFATQSGPMLVIDGRLHPSFDADGSSRYVRNAVGIGPDGQPLFVITTDVVSFGKMARFFRDELQARNALYLDGSVSSLWDPANGRMDDFVALGPLVVAFTPAGSAPRRANRATP